MVRFATVAARTKVVVVFGDWANRTDSVLCSAAAYVEDEGPVCGKGCCKEEDDARVSVFLSFSGFFRERD